MTSARASREPPIFCLLLAGCPAAIAGLVIAVIVWISIQSMPGWARTHIGKEVLELIPSVADRDPSTSIFAKSMAVGIAAAISHSIPRSVLGSAVHPMLGTLADFSSKIDAKASAGLSISYANIGSGSLDICSAITPESPYIAVASIGSTDKFNGSETSVPLTSSNRWEFSARSHFGLLDRLKWLGPAGVISTASGPLL